MTAHRHDAADYREVEHRTGAKPPAGVLREPRPLDPGDVEHRSGAKPPAGGGPSRAVALDRLIGALATKQGGLVTIEQLRQLGLTRREIQGRVARGFLIAIHRGVYLVGHRAVTDQAYLAAALMATGPDAFLSHRSAAAAWGLRPVDRRQIEVTVPGAGRRSRAAIWIHRVSPDVQAADVVAHNRLRVSSVPRMLIELGPRESRGELRRLVTQAIRAKILDVHAMQSVLERYARHPGVVAARSVVADYLPAPPGRSTLEDDFAAWLTQHAWLPKPQRNVHLGGWEIDFYWPQLRLAVETDGGPYHITIGDMERDRAKDTWLQRHHIRVMRVTDFRFGHERDAILEDLCAFMNLAQPPTAPPR